MTERLGRSSLARLAARASRLAGKRRLGVGFVLGALGSLAMPPVYALPLLVVAFTGLLWIADGIARPRAALALGWWFGFGHFIVGIYWIANAFLTDVEKFGWMIPFAVGGLAAVLAAFPALALVATQALRLNGVARVIGFAGLWTLLEWVRGWIFTGLPWNPVGSVWAFSETMIQGAALAGVWGLGLVTVAAFAMPASLARSGRGPLIAMAVAVLTLGALWGGGAARLAGASEATVPGVHLRLVQAAIDPRQKARADMRMTEVARHLALTIDTPGFAAATLVVWPETAARYLLDRSPELRLALGSAAPPGGLLITGMPRAEPASGQVERIWNSLGVLDRAGNILATYDKFHLVPWGEYVPWRRVFPFIDKLTPGSLDFSAGPGPRTLHLPGLPPVGALICYEVVFPGRVVDPGDRPAWLLNLTNDAWYGDSFGPYQHLVAARLRAVEEGLPLVRAANTGISAVIDPYGRIRASLGLGLAGVLDADLPAALPGPTLYARFGDAAPGLLGLVAILATALLRRLRI